MKQGLPTIPVLLIICIIIGLVLVAKAASGIRNEYTSTPCAVSQLLAGSLLAVCWIPPLGRFALPMLAGTLAMGIYGLVHFHRNPQLTEGPNYAYTAFAVVGIAAVLAVAAVFYVASQLAS